MHTVPKEDQEAVIQMLLNIEKIVDEIKGATPRMLYDELVNSYQAIKNEAQNLTNPMKELLVRLDVLKDKIAEKNPIN